MVAWHPRLKSWLPVAAVVLPFATGLVGTYAGYLAATYRSPIDTAVETINIIKDTSVPLPIREKAVDVFAQQEGFKLSAAERDQVLQSISENASEAQVKETVSKITGKPARNSGAGVPSLGL